MITRNCTKEQLRQALESVNERYQGNIKFKTLEPKGKNFSFTLTVKDSKAMGGKIGHNGRRIAAACWHVHGHFFEELFKFAPDAKVLSRMAGTWITKMSGNWQDRNIGSMMYPLMFSQACDCNKKAQEAIDSMIPGRIQFRTLSKAMIMNCPACIFDPDHYKADGTCLCYDLAHQANLKAERKARTEKLLKSQKKGRK